MIDSCPGGRFLDKLETKYESNLSIIIPLTRRLHEVSREAQQNLIFAQWHEIAVRSSTLRGVIFLSKRISRVDTVFHVNLS